MRPLPTVLMLATVSLATACGSYADAPASPFVPPPNTLTCTLEARPALRIRVVDAQGSTQPDARITVTFDGDPELREECAEQCAEWSTLFGRAGRYVVTATSADGQRMARQEVQVLRDECHVITEHVTLTLPDAP